ncbi:unnamed protein product [Umbelopsis ramanniana]
MDNMWKGNLFSKSLGRLLLVCLRTNLAPKREERYFKLLKRHRSKPKKQPGATNNINRIRQLIHKENKNLTKCFRKLEDCASVSADSEAWTERISLAKARISNLVRELELAKSRKRFSSLTEATQNKLDDVDNKFDILRLHDYTEEEAAEAIVNNEDDEDNDDEEDGSDDDISTIQELEAISIVQDQHDILSEPMEDIQEVRKDTSASKIRSFKAILKNMLLADKEFENIGDEIRLRYSAKDNILTEESEVLVKLYQGIQPYITRKEGRKSSNDGSNSYVVEHCTAGIWVPTVSSQDLSDDIN